MNRAAIAAYLPHPAEAEAAAQYPRSPLRAALQREGGRTHALSLLRQRELRLAAPAMERRSNAALLPLSPTLSFTFPAGGSATALSFSPSGARLAVAEKDGELFFLSPRLELQARVDVSAHVRWIVSGVGWRDESTLIFSTLTPALNVVREAGGGGAAATQVLPLRTSGAPAFGVFGFAVAPGAAEATCATSDGRIVICSLETGRVADSWVCHGDDINSICYLAGKGEASDVICTGSDDGLLQLSDRRQPRRVCGVLPGHRAGVTSVHARGDGAHLCSNGKDQAIKVWDVRRSLTRADWEQKPASERNASAATFDYRWELPPPEVFERAHPLDTSVLTLRGSVVQRTLIRAKWSPIDVDGGRHIAAGSADGACCVWDLHSSTAAPCAVLPVRASLVRELAWHPAEAALVTGSYDTGRVQLHAARCEGGATGDEDGFLRALSDGGGTPSQRAGLIFAHFRLRPFVLDLVEHLQRNTSPLAVRKIEALLELANAAMERVGQQHGLPDIWGTVCNDGGGVEEGREGEDEEQGDDEEEEGEEEEEEEDEEDAERGND
jgi:WD40 repeat protein